ncbi:MAG: SagB/ThcOx family dehydrogenase [Thermodesulfobacteriota bacterium]
MPSMTASQYHHQISYDRHRMTPHSLDWANQPATEKNYPGIEPVKLPPPDRNFEGHLRRVYRGDFQTAPMPEPDLAELANILAAGHGLTARVRQPGTDFYLRSSPSAGALYPNELYMARFYDGQTAPGIYHYDIQRFALNPLRTGHYGPTLSSAVSDDCSGACAVFVITGIFFRSAWKYRARAYRYVLLDAGHLMENLRVAFAAAGYRTKPVLTFDDDAFNRLTGVDENREVAVCGLALVNDGKNDTAGAATEIPAVDESIRQASRVSPKEHVYREIIDIHRAGQNPPSPDPAFAGMADCIGVSAQHWQPVAEKAQAAAPIRNFHQTVVQRRSKRNFVSTPMKNESFFYLVDLICRAADDADRPGDYAASICCGVLTGQIENQQAGFYMIDTAQHAVGQVFEGPVTEKMAAVCLNQAWLANAAAHFVFLTNLSRLDRQWGPRGYRHAMITAGRLGHAVYLGATALGLGCCGIGAFYDFEARSLLGLTDDSAMLYLVAAGPVRG